MSHRVPELFVEQLALDELPESRTAEIRAALEAEEGGLDRLAAVERSNAELLDAFPAETVVPAARLAARAGRPSRTWVPALVAVAAAAALAIIALPGSLAPSEPDTRLKGLAPQLQIHRLEGTDAVELDQGDPAANGDLVQLSYVSAGERYGVIVSVDGRGAVTLHFPDRGRQSAELVGGGAHALDRSYQLDDAPAFERFFFVTSDRPFRVDQVMMAAEQLASDPSNARSGSLELPEPLSQEALIVSKVQP